MAQYIDKSALVAKIEKRIKETESMQPKFDQFLAGQISAFKGILKILDTLEVKNDFKPLDSDFERDAVSFCIDKGLNTTPYIAKTIAKYFFELGIKTQKRK